jgi:hypothetical protein
MVDIDPYRSNRVLKAERAHRQHVVLTHNPSSIEPRQTLQVRFPNLGDNDVIVPGSFFISFALNLKGTKDPARSVVPNVGRKIIKTLKINFEGNEVLSINNYDEIMTYKDFWLSKKDKAKRIFQGIQSENGLKLRVDSKGAKGDAEETAISNTYGNRFRIPIDFELLNDIGPYHQASLADKLEFKLTFNNKKAVILGSTTTLAESKDGDYDYSVTDIRTEWDQITSPALASTMRSVYQRLAVPFTRVLEHRFMSINKTDAVVNLNVNAPSKSMSHIVILAVDPEDRKAYQHKEVWKNLDITRVNIGIEGVENINALYASGLQTENTYDQVLKLFDSDDVSLGEFLTEKYALVLDLRPSVDSKLHGNGTSLINTSEGVTLQINRVASTPGTAGKLGLHVFVLSDAQLNILNSRFHSVEA